MKRRVLFGGLAALGISLYVADGLTVPRSAFHMTTITRLLDERQHLLRFFDGFVTSLDLQRRVPRVVVEQMEEKGDDEAGVADRSFCQFTGTHDAVPPKLAASLDDYRGRL
jgi:hypothetical protein